MVLVGDTARWPARFFVPVQPPEAVHEIALVEDQVTYEILPGVMLVGRAEKTTVGSAPFVGVDGGVDPDPDPDTEPDPDPVPDPDADPDPDAVPDPDPDPATAGGVVAEEPKLSFMNAFERTALPQSKCEM